jgi:lipopolysaccharide transport protein LptA
VVSCCTDRGSRNVRAALGWLLALCVPILSPSARPGETKDSEPPCHEPLCYTASRLEAERNRLLLYDIDIVDTTRGISHIKADVAEANGADIGSSDWVLTGHVQVYMPEGQLRADKATVQFVDKRIDTMTAEGAPAEFEHALDNGQTAHGHARSITFDMQRNEVQLNGDGWLSDGCREITSGHIGYDIGSQRMWADNVPGDSARVHGTIRTGNAPGSANPCAQAGARQ